MCGITGIYAFNENGKSYFNKINESIKTLSFRGPDDTGTFKHNNVALGHSRLAIIDTTSAASQPFTDNSGRYTIIFNGEFYNFKEHQTILKKKGVKFKSNSDTEVLLYLYINEGISFLNKVNGCFALAIYDNKDETLLIARDRIGIKPLIIYHDDDKLIFASEMKAILAYNIPKKINNVSLYNYLQFNYIPSPYSIFENTEKLIPGSYILIKNKKIEKKQYYKIPYPNKKTDLTYNQAQQKLNELLSESVKLRMISDVPLGAFLSGGIDSSVIVALASQFTKNLNTFSIGYKDEPFYDETYYADLVAKKYKTNHTVFSLSNDDLFNNLYKVLDYIDEPFADSSALAVNILSMHTREKVTVALSGDGADEMFAGYNKHMAHFKANNNNFVNSIIKIGSPFWGGIPQSRNNKFGNIIRQINRFSEGLNLSEKERYWRWCSINNEQQAGNLLNSKYANKEYQKIKNSILAHINKDSSISNILYSDMHLVLQSDMLHKVDHMSMANSLEVRTPFLDHNIVDFAFQLPDSYKINKSTKKRILQDSFRHNLPEELYNRPKHGFEVPMLKWFRNELKSLITDDLLNDNFIKEQNIFNVDVIKKMKLKLFSTNPQDIQSQIWGLLVFQYWWKKNFY
ncbi:MAG: asparagine synthase (glutamine-hydrolyzing) [Bacteroidetes bacterium]|nr:asparagine synthase (glutamine-hydrolyzing) [Bacteroidota bacterium]